MLGAVAIFSVSSLAASNAPNPDAANIQISDSAGLAVSNLPAAPSHVVELFTSQGCSSCPPANKFVGTVADKDGVLVLSYGVTYWDHLGWKDTFGDPSFTKRQRRYRPILGTSNIYTPQIVLNGEAHSPRYSENDVLSATIKPSSASSRIVMRDGKLMIEGDVPSGSVVAFISYMPGLHEVAVKRGENGGRKLKLTNVVTNIVEMPWKDQAIETKVEAEAGLSYAALFHAPKTGNIISAATYTPKS